VVLVGGFFPKLKFSRGFFFISLISEAGMGRGWESIPGLRKRFQIWALVAMGHKNINAPLILKIRDIIFLFWANYIMGHFSGNFEGASTFLTLKLSLAALGTI
jgi:hypothetical protein